MKKMNYIYKVSAAVAFAAAMILSASCSKERQFQGEVTGNAEVRFTAAVASNTTSFTTKSGVLTGADGISIPFTMVSEPGINGKTGESIATKGTLYNTTGEDMALAAAGINKFRIVAFNSDYTYFIPAMTDVNYADGKWSTATPYTWEGGECKAFCALANYDGDVTVTVGDDGPAGTIVQTIPDQAKDQKEMILATYTGNGDSDGDGICDGVVSLEFIHQNAGVIFKMGDMPGVSRIRRISLENVVGSRIRIYKRQASGLFDLDESIDGDTKTVWQDIEGPLPAEGEIIGEPFILNPQSTQNVILHVYVTIFGKNYDLVANLADADGWDRGCTSVYTLGFSETIVEPLCFTSEGLQTVYFNRKLPDGSAPNLQYSTDGDSWTEWEDPTAPVEFDGTLYLIGLNPSGFRAVEDFEHDTDEGFIFGNQDVPVTLSGNQMSIIDYRFPVQVPSRGCFAQLYILQECIKSAAELKLPATDLKDYCYSFMFQICPNLEDAPELPATKMRTGCYLGMFSGCESLKECPSLPATKLADECYRCMFEFCLNLKETCSLPAVKMYPWCYEGMFTMCENLVTAPALPAMELAERCYSNMFDGCKNLVTAPALPAMELAECCYSEMFEDCNNLVTAPALPAMELAERCYSAMFVGCKNLVTAPALPAMELAERCYSYMFAGCKNLVTAPALPAAVLAEECYSNMFTSCRNLNYIEMLATDITAPNCLDIWTYGVPETGTFVKSPALGTRTNASDDNTRICLDSPNGIPTGWTVENADE